MLTDTENIYGSISRVSSPSQNLSELENNLVFQMIGGQCRSLCTTVAQIYETEPLFHTEWYKKCTGVLCFVKDYMRKSYFLRMFCLRQKRMIWEQELYDEIEIEQPERFLITFEGSEGMVALNFAFTDEADWIFKAFNTIVQAHKKKKEERMNRRSRALPQVPVCKPETENINLKNSIDEKKNKSKKWFGREKKPKPGKKPKLTKDAISGPSNFEHISHVGSKNSDIERFLKEAGISEQHLNDPQTVDLIYGIVEDYRVKNSPQVPSSLPRRGPIYQNFATRELPKVPECTLPAKRPLPAIPSSPPQCSSPYSARRQLPPAPSTPVPKRPPKQPMMVPEGKQEVKASSSGPPPPPPPPMDLNLLSSEGAVPIPPAPSHNKPSDPRDQLLESIRNGKQLKSTKNVDGVCKPLPSSCSDPRDQLLEAIRNGIKLKSTNNEVKSNKKGETKISSVNGVEDLMQSIQNAITMRYEPVHGDESEYDFDECDDSDEWE